ncbi:ArsR/SmtB family transcription factor, partial [Erythrobacter donghaensis]
MSIAEAALVEALKALAHPLRWRILRTLASGERNVGEIEQATGIGQPALSQQLGVLRKAGLVVTRKDAKLVF